MKPSAEVLLASAGSGKTFQLTLRYAALVLDGVPLKNILAATFTRKAAGEIQSRVLERLAGAAEGGTGPWRLARIHGAARFERQGLHRRSCARGG